MIVVLVLTVRGHLVVVLVLVAHGSLAVVDEVHFDIFLLLLKQWFADIIGAAARTSNASAASDAEATDTDAAEASKDAEADDHSNLAHVARVLISAETVDGTAARALGHRHVLHDTILHSAG